MNNILILRHMLERCKEAIFMDSPCIPISQTGETWVDYFHGKSSEILSSNEETQDSLFQKYHSDTCMKHWRDVR
jgi:hypothetical protein